MSKHNLDNLQGDRRKQISSFDHYELDEKTGIKTYYNGNGQVIGIDYPDGTYEFTTWYENNNYTHYARNGDIIFYNSEGEILEYITAKASNSYKNFFDDDGNIMRTEYYDNSWRIAREVYTDGSFVRYYRDDDSGKKTIEYFDTEGKSYKIIWPSGDITYNISNEIHMTLYPDNTFYIPEIGLKGTYKIDKNGMVTCTDENGAIYHFNDKGHLYAIEDQSSTTGIYDWQRNSKIRLVNNKSRYSMLNHIKYDEETYENIITKLYSIDGEYRSSISTKCQNNIDIVSGFSDSYSASEEYRLQSILLGDLDAINQLKESVNYSLLAYQTCDDKLKEAANRLIDSLFDEGNLSRVFKRIVNSTVSDTYHDGILAYLPYTNFRALYNNLFPSKEMVDQFGNTWYFNNNNQLLDISGGKGKMTYGGENFSVSFLDGVLILKDSNNNSIDIFGDYNLDSSQYGSNIFAFGGDNNDALLGDPYIQGVLDSYFPDATDAERRGLLDLVNKYGLYSATLTNVAFKVFQGKENDFYNNFGFQMYNVVLQDDNTLAVDYNYEPIILDFFCDTQRKKTKSLSEILDKKTLKEIYGSEINEYFIEKYHLPITRVSGAKSMTLPHQDRLDYRDRYKNRRITLTAYEQFGFYQNEQDYLDDKDYLSYYKEAVRYPGNRVSVLEPKYHMYGRLLMVTGFYSDVGETVSYAGKKFIIIPHSDDMSTLQENVESVRYLYY